MLSDSVASLQDAIKNAEIVENFEYMTESEKEKISIIILKASNIGFSSLCFVGKCDFDGNVYGEDDIIYDRVYGIRKLYPYNSVQYHSEKKWMFDCLSMYKFMDSGCFPNTDDFKYHNLPKVLKVTRSNGTVQDAITTSPYYGIQVRKPSTTSANKNPKINIYVSLLFHNDFKTLNETDIYKLETVDNASIKDLTLEQLVEANPHLKENELVLKYYSIPIDDGMSEEQENVINYFNDILRNWCEQYLDPVLKKYTNDGIMRCSYQIC